VSHSPVDGGRNALANARWRTFFFYGKFDPFYRA
jgi:hypothetical protein